MSRINFAEEESSSDEPLGTTNSTNFYLKLDSVCERKAKYRYIVSELDNLQTDPKMRESIFKLKEWISEMETQMVRN